MELGDSLGARDWNILALKLDLSRSLVLFSKGSLNVAVRNTGLSDLFVSDKNHLPCVVWLVIHIWLTLRHY